MRFVGLLAIAVVPTACATPDAQAPLSLHPTCVDPARGPLWGGIKDVTPRSGLDFQYAATSSRGGGLAVVDLDGDDLPEIIAGRRTGGVALFRNRGGLGFEPADLGIEPTFAVHAVAAADLDDDGDRDVVIAGPDSAAVLENLGSGDLRESSRLLDSGTTEHVLPVDVDGDGRLDLYFGNYDVRVRSDADNRLYRNLGGLVLSEAARIGEGMTWATTALDLEGDGDVDLYVANDTLAADFGDGVPSLVTGVPVDLLLRNDGLGADGVPRFTNIAADLRLDAPRSSMGGLLADLDDDGALEMYVPDLGAKKVFELSGATPVVDRAWDLGLRATRRSDPACATSTDPGCLLLTWSAAATDFDLDGDDELFVINGSAFVDDQPPQLVYERGDDGTYRELAPPTPCMDAHGLVVTDLDRDGDQDVVIAPANGPLGIYETIGRPAPESWLRVTLQGSTSNRDGIGAVVRATRADGRVLTRVVGHGGATHVGAPAEAFFGLGPHPVVRLEVGWPSGRRTEHPGVTGAVVLREN